LIQCRRRVGRRRSSCGEDGSDREKEDPDQNELRPEMQDRRLRSMLTHICALPAAKQHNDSPADTGERQTRPLDSVPKDVT
jgi:hypothetical protein